MLKGLCIGLLLLVAESAYGQPVSVDKWTPAFPTQAERQAADLASWGTALSAIALDTRASWVCQERLHCFERQGERVALVYSAAFLAKWLAHRQRPCAPSCGIDNPNSSFFSGHTAIAFSTLGGASIGITVPLAAGTGALRVAAGKHWLTDVLAGAVVGTAISRLR